MVLGFSSRPRREEINGKVRLEKDGTTSRTLDEERLETKLKQDLKAGSLTRNVGGAISGSGGSAGGGCNGWTYDYIQSVKGNIMLADVDDGEDESDTNHKWVKRAIPPVARLEGPAR